MTSEKKDVNYTLLEKTESSKLKKLIDTYKKDPYAARVIFFNGNKNEFFTSRLVIFEHVNGDFEICIIRKTFGVSVTNRMYSRDKKEFSIIYSKKKFYYKSNKKLTQLTFNGLHSFIYSWSSYKDDHSVMKYMEEKFSWIRFIRENPILHGTAFNTFIRYKLYNLKDALRYTLKAPWPVIKILLGMSKPKKDNNESDFDKLISARSSDPRYLLKRWKEIHKYLKNVESLKLEMYNHHVFDDTCRMAKVLDKKVNCSWSIKRLVEEHDKWAREITHIVLSNEPKYDLKIASIYREFAKFSGYNLLTTNIDLLAEGMVQNHCVGTYISRVERGACAIFHIEGFTLEVGYGPEWTYDGSRVKQKSENVFKYVQFRGKHNGSAPKHLDDAVKEKIKEFDVYYREKLKTSSSVIEEPVAVDDGLDDLLNW